MEANARDVGNAKPSRWTKAKAGMDVRAQHCQFALISAWTTNVLLVDQQ